MKVPRGRPVLYDQPVGDPCDAVLHADRDRPHRKHVALRDLDADGEPEAIVGLFTGGANCCVLVLAYGYDAAANVYRRARLDTGGGYVARDYGGDGVIELVGDDFRFRGLFTCGACGPRPIRIWHYGLRRFEVVTRDFPAKIRAHARRMRRFYERVRRERGAFVKGALTPYAADLCLLDRCAAASGWCAPRSGAASSTAARLRRLAAGLRVPARAEALPAPHRLPRHPGSDDQWSPPIAAVLDAP